jgi:hypothetical protein
VSYSSVEASDENFIQVDFESPVDLHKFAQLNVEFAPDMDWPDQMEAAIIDRNGVFNANDLFVLNDFPVSEDNKTLSYVFTDVEDGGKFLPSRVKSLRFWFERTSGTNRTVDFIIENIWFSEADPGNAIFEKNRFSDIRVWPNPARNFLYFENMGSPVKAWEIYSIPGRKVAEGNLSGQKNMISVANLPDGLYVLIMKAGDGTYYRTKFRVRK